MKKGLFNRRIPTVAALLVLIGIIGVSTFLIQKGVFYIGKAAPDTQPQNLSITNITDTSFTVAFTTSTQSDAVLNTDDTKIGKSITLDDRDKKTGIQNKYYSHHITVPNLSPSTSYIFKLIVSGKEYTNPAYTVKTGNPITVSPPAQNPLFGKILLPDSSPASDSIVTAKTDTSELISAITDAKGEFILPTNSLRDTQNNQYVILSNETIFTIKVFRQLMNAKITSTFLLAQNLPALTLTQQYTFVANTDQLSTASSQLNFSLPSTNGKTVDIINPIQGKSYTDQRPLFNGTSYPNSNVELSIPGFAQEQIVTASDGSWNYQPTNNIPQGNHSIKILVVDPNNNPITVTKTFNIFPQGSQVVESATQSATPTIIPTATPTKTPSPTPTLIVVSPTVLPSQIPTATPTSMPGSTSTPTPTLQPTALPTPIVNPTNKPTISEPGGINNTVFLTGLSLFLIITGTVLLFAL